MTASRLIDELSSKAGVSPSWHFLRDCCDALGHETSSTDDVLQQILHHDLRDVVRILEPTQTSENYSNLASVQLRRAVSNSLSASSNYKSMLPESFRLLVQVEELVDMTLAAEARHAGGNRNDSSISNHATVSATSRCLKLLLSDGYYADGRPVEDNQENVLDASQSNFIVGMEISHIPQLSATTSSAGLKVLLKGPMLVRHGILQVHAGNLIVVGGHVAHLVQLQKQARQQAQRLAGVDPTIRALIGPEGLMDETQDDGDEGEGESSDVAAHPLVPAGQTRPQQQQEFPVSTPHVPQQPVQRPSVNLGSSRLAPPYIATPLHTSGSSNSGSTAMAGYRGGISGGGASGGGDTQRPFVTAPRPANPYATSVSNTSSSRNLSQPGSSSDRTPPVSTGFVMASGAPALAIPNSGSTTTSNSPAAFASQTVSPTLSSHTTHSGSSGADVAAVHSQVLTFNDLQTLLLRMRTDETLYRQNVGKTFRTLLQQDGVKLYFNIEKKKKETLRKDEKKDDKYEYAMSARFKSPGFDGLVTCKIASSILEPFFGVKPGEMRKMNREDKQRANDIVRDGGRKVQEVLNGRHYYDWTLLQTPEEFFAKSPAPDGTEPILLLVSLQM
ncbi:hypothetical protein MPSEU_000646200 [Mayamaea pseudoterrestris]|nr:hypothetical protein MPSEU_000646200 [Mayamaea pseudoterrestris]